MEVKPGHKQTEVGVIPEEWDVSLIGQQCQIFGRIGFRGYTVDDIVEEGSGAIAINPSNVQDGKTIFDKCTYISWHKYEESPEIKIHEGDIILVKTGSTFGKTAMVKNLPGKATLNPQVIVFKKIKGSRGFFGYMMGFPTIQKQITAAVVGGALPTLSQKLVAAFKMPLPRTLPEQRAIATALSDVDGLLGGLDRLIAKKRDLKQAAMQQLFTGQTRLPGFHGEWEVKRLEQSCELITKGTTPTSLGRNFTESGVNFLKAESLSENGETIPDKVAFIDAATHKLLKRSQLKAGDLLISIAGVLGRVGRVSLGVLPANTNQALAIVRLGNASELDRNFLFYCLLSPMTAKQISDVNVQAAQANISLQNVRDLKIHVPPTIPEQTAIAEVLTEMDGELSALEQLREKTRALKQAMMQELLTGRTRLI